MKSTFPLILAAFLLTATFPATAETESPADAPAEAAVSKSDCSAWVKREKKRYSKALTMLRRVKKDAAAKAVDKGIKNLFLDKAGNKKDPCPDTKLTDQYFPITDDAEFMKLIKAIGDQLNRIEELGNTGKMTEETAYALIDTVHNNMKIASY